MQTESKESETCSIGETLVMARQIDNLMTEISDAFVQIQESIFGTKEEKEEKNVTMLSQLQKRKEDKSRIFPVDLMVSNER